ncbi:hypothetical protein [Fundidesulfovibrio terrae]|uniref:hypothetical protein n=1 Tax=Fundidesulfovibrio terrae TaxID=2922866 RepID=UPI001FAF495E|nr:hypothetical protein [Fundidesulfovibrio terrae]
MPRTPFQSILARLMATPGMINHLNAVDIDGDGNPDVMIPPLGPPPQDPMGRMRWQAMAEQRSRLVETYNRNKAQGRAARKNNNDNTLLQTLAAADPLFPTVYPMVADYIRHLPRGLGQHVMHGTNSHPGLFLELYKHIRDYLEAAIWGNSPARSGAMASRSAQAGAEDPRARIRRAVAGRMSAPVLENAGIMDDRLPGATRAAELAALKARCKAGKAREGDLLRYIELSMPEN